MQLGLHSRMHGHHMISNDRVAVKGVPCQPSAASGVDRRSAGDLRYRLGLDHLGLCKPVMRSWNRSGDWQGASVVWPVLVWYGWIYAAWGRPEQHLLLETFGFCWCWINCRWQNQADLQMEFTKTSELKALSNIAPRFLTLLAVDISIESILILFTVMGFLRLLFISTKTSVLSMFRCNMTAVIQHLMSMTQFWMLLMARGNDSALIDWNDMYSCVSSA